VAFTWKGDLKVNDLKQNEKDFWQKYIVTLPEHERPTNPHVEAQFAGNREITDDLLELYLIGKKTAGSGLVEDYISSGAPLPKVGNYWILLNSRDEPGCILRTERTITHKFKDVPVEIAIAEGEGDLSLAYWRHVHKEFFRPFLSRWNVENIEEATVITEFFKVVYR